MKTPPAAARTMGSPRASSEAQSPATTRRAPRPPQTSSTAANPSIQAAAGHSPGTSAGAVSGRECSAAAMRMIKAQSITR